MEEEWRKKKQFTTVSYAPRKEKDKRNSDKEELRKDKVSETNVNPFHTLGGF